MRIDVVTGFPGILEGPLDESIIRQARMKNLVEIVLHDLRNYTHDRHRTIDDEPYGGGAGMVLKPEPFFECFDELSADRSYNEVIYLSPDGELFTQKLANDLSLKNSLMILCGHYRGIDERIREKLVTREISIGEYVLSGGEIPALVVIDAIARLIPGVLHDAESALEDSFQSEDPDHPHYTHPPEYRGMRVPEVLLSGNHEVIAQWRREEASKRAALKRK